MLEEIVQIQEREGRDGLESESLGDGAPNKGYDRDSI